MSLPYNTDGAVEFRVFQHGSRNATETAICSHYLDRGEPVFIQNFSQRLKEVSDIIDTDSSQSRNYLNVRSIEIPFVPNLENVRESTLKRKHHQGLAICSPSYLTTHFAAMCAS